MKTAVRLLAYLPIEEMRAMPPQRATRQHEHTINVVLASALDGLGHSWTVEPEPLKVFSGEGRVDMLISMERSPPVVIEAEVSSGNQSASRVEKEALGRLRRRLSGEYGGWELNTVVALLYPDMPEIKGMGELEKALKDARYEYAVYATDSHDATRRFPEKGWIDGSLFDLAYFIHLSRNPVWKIEEMALGMRRAIEGAAQRTQEFTPASSRIGEDLARALMQKDDGSGQTRRMAMAVLLNAMLFHDALDASKMEIKSSGREVMPVDRFIANGGFNGPELQKEWQNILQENYWPIFTTSLDILRCLPGELKSSVLSLLWETGEYLTSLGAARSHDLIGMVFQRLICDRQFLAAYYTRPEAAWLLAGLALTERGIKFSRGSKLAKARIGDFACGTGTLLTTAYQRFMLLYESRGGDPSKIHAEMMEKGLVGLDVLPIAVHLTATALAGLFPQIMFKGECILKMPYGFFEGTPLVGSIELLSESGVDYRAMFGEHAEVIGGQEKEKSFDFNQRIGSDFDLVIMNPPFTRSGDDIEGAISPVAAMEFSREDQVRLNNRLKHLTKGGAGQGGAGLASHFTDIGHRRLRTGGRLALVLPMTALTGESWGGVRELWRSWYEDIVVVTIAGAKGADSSFSSDTGMSECLFIGTKKEKSSGSKRRGHFAVLATLPSDTVSGSVLADAIHDAIAEGNVPTLEGGPFGGKRVFIGETEYGNVLDCPLPENDAAWPVAGVRDLSLAQSAYQLERGSLWTPGMTEGMALPIAQMGKVVQFGRYHLAIAGKTIDKSSGLPQGPFDILDGCSKADEFPSLWKHDAPRERTMVVEPGQHLQVRKVPGKLHRDLMPMVEHVLERNSRLHYNFEFRFNSQSIIAAMTERPAVGGSAWPNVVLGDEASECLFALWCNSTLGLLCHWWMASKVQGGRGRVSHGTAGAIPTLELGKISPRRRQAAKNAFNQMRDARFLPFNQLHEDEARKCLDRALLVEILGLPASLCDKGGAMEILREKLASEPQIHGGKKTRVVFTQDGERTEALSAREMK